MSAYVELQEREFAVEADGYTATRHQREVGTGYFDEVAAAHCGESSTLALHGLDRRSAVHGVTAVDDAERGRAPGAAATTRSSPARRSPSSRSCSAS